MPDSYEDLFIEPEEPPVPMEPQMIIEEGIDTSQNPVESSLDLKPGKRLKCSLLESYENLFLAPEKLAEELQDKPSGEEGMVSSAGDLSKTPFDKFSKILNHCLQVIFKKSCF